MLVSLQQEVALNSALSDEVRYLAFVFTPCTADLNWLFFVAEAAMAPRVLALLVTLVATFVTKSVHGQGYYATSTGGYVTYVALCFHCLLIRWLRTDFCSYAVAPGMRTRHTPQSKVVTTIGSTVTVPFLLVVETITIKDTLQTLVVGATITFMHHGLALAEATITSSTPTADTSQAVCTTQHMVLGLRI